jgi:hypothetical protein
MQLMVLNLISCCQAEIDNHSKNPEAYKESIHCYYAEYYGCRLLKKAPHISYVVRQRSTTTQRIQKHTRNRYTAIMQNIMGIDAEKGTPYKLCFTALLNFC